MSTQKVFLQVLIFAAASLCLLTGDDMVLELAVSAGCQYIVTFNRRHFTGSEPFGIEIVTPWEFLE